MLLSRRWSAFLIAVGVWTWLIWPRFGVAIWRDPRSFVAGAPTSFLWAHALLIAASLLIGTAVAVLGVKGWRATRTARRPEASPDPKASPAPDSPPAPQTSSEPEPKEKP